MIYEQAQAKTGIVKNHVHSTPIAKRRYDRCPASGLSAVAASCTVCMFVIPFLKRMVHAVNIMKNVAMFEKIIPTAFHFCIK